ncbi:ankyrin repeat domain-containing protein, partial [Pseudomonas aeruginosa]
MLDAAREDCGERVKELLIKKPELKYEKDEDGLTALHWAADRNAINALSAALSGGRPIDAVDECGQTALHYAVSCGHVESTKILTKAGATLLEDEEGNTPLDLAT